MDFAVVVCCCGSPPPPPLPTLSTNSWFRQSSLRLSLSLLSQSPKVSHLCTSGVLLYGVFPSFHVTAMMFPAHPFTHTSSLGSCLLLKLCRLPIAAPLLLPACACLPACATSSDCIELSGLSLDTTIYCCCCTAATSVRSGGNLPTADNK